MSGATRKTRNRSLTGGVSPERLGRVKEEIETSPNYPVRKREKREKCEKKECKSEVSMDFSVSEAEEALHMHTKEEIWESETNGKRDANRRALDRFAEEHQRRVKEEFLGKEKESIERKRPHFEEGFTPMKVEIFARSPSPFSHRRELFPKGRNTEEGTSEERKRIEIHRPHVPPEGTKKYANKWRVVPKRQTNWRKANREIVQ